MGQFFDDVFKAQPYSLCIIAGLVLIGVGVVGSIKSYIDPGKYGRIAALGIGVVLLAIGFTLYARQPAAPTNPGAAANPRRSPRERPAQPAPAAPTTPADTPADNALSRVCKFSAGPLAGSTHELPRAQPHPVGTACHDLRGNSGTIVAANTPLTP